MLRVIFFLAVIAAVATGLSWLADRPGNLVINWEGYVIETSVFRAVVLLAGIVGSALVLWSLLRHIWESPAAIGTFLNRRKQKRGLDALSAGMIAIGSGDRSMATRYAVQARRSLPNEPLTHLLRAQAAQLTGDQTTSRRIFEAMLNTPDTEQLGLRGLFLEAERVGETEAALQFAERAVKLNPKLEWPVTALFDLQCKTKNWAGALKTLSIAKRHGHLEKASADRRRAVLLTAQALAAEDNNPETALTLALEANSLARDLVPAAAFAARMLSSRGNTPRATKIVERAWKTSPHPDLATAYAYARLGDSPRDRLERVKRLAGINPYSIESPIAVALSAVEAKDFDTGRRALEPLLDDRVTQRVCTLMARIEGEQNGDRGRVREWLARAVNAQRDPAWTAEGIVADEWSPISPNGVLDAFQWRVPVERLQASGSTLAETKLEDLVALGASSDIVEEVVQEVTTIDVAAAAIDPGGSDAISEQTSDTIAATEATANRDTPQPTQDSAKDRRADLPEHPAHHTSAAAQGQVMPGEGADNARTATTASDTAADRSQTVTPGEPPVPGDKHDNRHQTGASTTNKHAPKTAAGTEKSSKDSKKQSADKGKDRAKNRKRGGSSRPVKEEPRIFVSPPAPDDPGPEAVETDFDAPGGPPKPYRISS